MAKAKQAFMDIKASVLFSGSGGKFNRTTPRTNAILTRPLS